MGYRLTTSATIDDHHSVKYREVSLINRGDSVPPLLSRFTDTLFSINILFSAFFFAFILTFTEVQLLPVKIVALNSSVTPWWSLSASALVSVAPLIIVAFIVERYLSKGNLSGAIK